MRFDSQLEREDPIIFSKKGYKKKQTIIHSPTFRNPKDFPKEATTLCFHGQIAYSTTFSCKSQWNFRFCVVSFMNMSHSRRKPTHYRQPKCRSTNKTNKNLECPAHLAFSSKFPANQKIQGQQYK